MRPDYLVIWQSRLFSAHYTEYDAIRARDKINELFCAASLGKAVIIEVPETDGIVGPEKQQTPRSTEERSDTATAAGEAVSLTSQSTVSGEKE